MLGDLEGSQDGGGGGVSSSALSTLPPSLSQQPQAKPATRGSNTTAPLSPGEEGEVGGAEEDGRRQSNASTIGSRSPSTPTGSSKMSREAAEARLRKQQRRGSGSSASPAGTPRRSAGSQSPWRKNSRSPRNSGVSSRSRGRAPAASEGDLGSAGQQSVWPETASPRAPGSPLQISRSTRAPGSATELPTSSPELLECSTYLSLTSTVPLGKESNARILEETRQSASAESRAEINGLRVESSRYLRQGEFNPSNRESKAAGTNSLEATPSILSKHSDASDLRSPLHPKNAARRLEKEKSGGHDPVRGHSHW